jgi:hypothetical protein
VAGVYGALFGVIWRLAARVSSRLPPIGAGLAYGLVLWLLAVVVTTSRPTGEWLRALPAVHLLVAHLLYGLTLGVALRRLYR